MDRRGYLAALGASVALAGCSAGGGGGGSGASDGTSTETTTATGTPPQNPEWGAGDVDLPVTEEDLTRGAPTDAIPAITEPAFAADWSDAGRNGGLSLADDDRVIGVTRDGSARAYPIRILDWHEIVNDTFGGPLLVTFCPLCDSGVVAERRVAGEETVFGVSGWLWHSDLVMYDRATGSLWSQIRAQAISGARTGDRLSVQPFATTTWGDWRSAHPDTEVLLPPPDSRTIGGAATRNYAGEAYAGYAENDEIGLGINEFEDDRLHPKTRVIGVESGETDRAYPLDAVTEAGVVQETVGDLPVVVTTTAGGSLVAYDRRVDGEALSFASADGRHLRAGGSRWRRTSGVAVDGPHEGTTLDRANDRSPMFWFAWADFNPGTELYRG